MIEKIFCSEIFKMIKSFIHGIYTELKKRVLSGESDIFSICSERYLSKMIKALV